MPYDTNEDLPDSVARHLPPHAQDIYRAAFNHASRPTPETRVRKKRPTGSHGPPSSVHT
jgi:cation transport regulator ChaB